MQEFLQWGNVTDWEIRLSWHRGIFVLFVPQALNTDRIKTGKWTVSNGLHLVRNTVTAPTVMLILCRQGSLHFISCNLVQNDIVQQPCGSCDHIVPQFSIHGFPLLRTQHSNEDRSVAFSREVLSYKHSGATLRNWDPNGKGDPFALICLGFSKSFCPDLFRGKKKKKLLRKQMCKRVTR